MIVFFTAALFVICAVFAVSAIRTDVFNREVHRKTFSGAALFTDSSKADGFSVSAVPRGSTWTKASDLNNEGLTDYNYQAHTYDIYVTNNTNDEVRTYFFKATFGKQAPLLSGWNGAFEIHQMRDSGELVSSIPDLRDYNPADYSVQTVHFDGDTLVSLRRGDPGSLQKSGRRE